MPGRAIHAFPSCEWRKRCRALFRGSEHFTLISRASAEIHATDINWLVGERRVGGIGRFPRMCPAGEIIEGRMIGSTAWGYSAPRVWRFVPCSNANRVVNFSLHRNGPWTIGSHRALCIMHWFLKMHRVSRCTALGCAWLVGAFVNVSRSVYVLFVCPGGWEWMWLLVVYA